MHYVCSLVTTDTNVLRKFSQSDLVVQVFQGLVPEREMVFDDVSVPHRTIMFISLKFKRD